MAVTKTVMRPALHSAAVIGQEVPVWDIRDEFGDTNMLVTTNEMGDSLARAVGKGKAALMRGHGSVIVGKIGAGRRVHDVLSAPERGGPDQGHVHGREITYLSPGEVDQSGELHTQPLSPGARVGRLVFASRRGQSFQEVADLRASTLQRKYRTQLRTFS